METTSETCLNITSPAASAPLSHTAFILIGAYLTMLGVSSVICNSTVIYVLCKGSKEFFRTHAILLMNLSLTDMLIAIVAIPLSSSSSYYGEWLYGDKGCILYGFTVFFLSIVDLNTLVAIAIYRYIVVCKPEYEYVLKRKSAVYKWVILPIWLYAFIWTGAPLVGWSSYKKEAYGTSCTINWSGTKLVDITYNGTIFVSCFVIHLTIFIFCYFNIMRQFKVADRSTITQAQNMTANDSITGAYYQEANEGAFLEIENILWYHKVTTSRSITMTSLAMIIGYLFVWIPYTLVSLWSMFGAQIPMWLHVIPTMIAKSCCLINPVMYGMFNDNFRKSLKILLRKKMKNQHPATMAIEEQPNSASNNDNEATRNLRYKKSSLCRAYAGHLTLSSGIYYGKNEVTLPVEESVI